MTLMFIHGAGGFVEDRAIVDRLDGPVTMPEFSDDDMTFEAWAVPIREHLNELDAADLVVAHSFGASILLKVLGEQKYTVSRAVLLAMPDWTPQGWDVAEYAFEGPEPATALALHHCLDDEVVPFDHLQLHARRLPSATFTEHPTGGHQFEMGAEVVLLQGNRPISLQSYDLDARS